MNDHGVVALFRKYMFWIVGIIIAVFIYAMYLIVTGGTK